MNKSTIARTGRSYSKSQVKNFTPAAAQHTDSGRAYSRRVASKNYSSMRRKKSKRKRILIVTVVIVLALLIGGGAAALGYIGMINSKFHSGVDTDAMNDVLVSGASDSEPFYILLLGTDARKGETEYRADTIILARVDTGKKQVVLVSIPRDTRFYLDGIGYTKINDAQQYYGTSGAVQAVSSFAGVGISHFAQINFGGFKDLVDEIGGVEVTVTTEIDDPKAGGYLAAGTQVLNGDQALIFCRSRAYAIGDFQRQANQRAFLQALASKLLSADKLTLMKGINAIAESVQTDMSVNDILSVASALRGMTTANIYSYSVPYTTQTIDGVDYVVANEEEWTEMMKTIDAGELPEEQEWYVSGVVADQYTNKNASSSAKSPTNVDRGSFKLTVRNGCGMSGCASQVAKKLQNAGYGISDTGNTDSYVYDETLVIYNNDDYLAAVNDIISILGVGTPVESNGRYKYDGDILIVVGSDW